MEDELIQRCKKGDQQAFVELFRIHGSMIQKITFKMTKQQDWQRDIYQDVVSKVIENIGTFKGNCKFSTWLYRITVNCVYAMLSREIPDKNMEPMEIVDNGSIQKGQNNPDIFENNERLTSVIACMKQLQKDYREIMSLFYFGEQSIEEIAKATGKSSGAIKAVLWKGRLAIIKNLKKQGILNLL